MRLTRLAALAVAGLAPALLVAPARRASAAATPVHARGVAASRCTARQGTIVAVDFAHWGGPIVRGCALGAGSAAGALHAVGITTAGDAHDGPAFVCRLGDAAFRHGAQYPTAAQQACIDTPAASGYWSSWLAPAGADRFSYSQLGVGAEPARPGEVQLWTFGATNIAGTRGSGVPAFSPARLRPGAADAAGAAGASARVGGTRLVDALAAPGSTSSGSPAGFVIGVCIALGLLATAGVVSRRRRRSP